MHYASFPREKQRKTLWRDGRERDRGKKKKLEEKKIKVGVKSGKKEFNIKRNKFVFMLFFYSVIRNHMTEKMFGAGGINFWSKLAF